MNSKIYHRGPDDAGVYRHKNVGLAMRRLSIIDVASGHQPLSNEDGTVWIVFNGEIYNHNELRKNLEAQEHRYRTRSDTETIVHLYEEYGRDCVHHLHGMFAFVIWDAKRRTLFGARDRLGIKPFYWYSDEQKFLFGSEVKALLAHGDIKATLNETKLPEYLAMGYVCGTETLFESIHQLAPGHTIEIDQSAVLSIRRYWDLAALGYEDNFPRRMYEETYQNRLEESVHSHMLSDVPLGVFLSGGIDSSAIAALTAQASPDPINTFSVGYTESPFSELPYAREVAHAVGAHHHEVRVSRTDFFDSLPALTEIQDEPLTWPSNAALFFVARLARESVTVVLTGEGSDETLGGYTRYAYTLLNQKLDRTYRAITPTAFRRQIRGFINDTSLISADLRRKLGHTFMGRAGESWESFYFDNFYSAFSETEQADLLVKSGSSPYEGSMEAWNASRGSLLQRLLYTDIKTYLVALLMKQDRMSMAASIESRVPFLEHTLAEYAFQIPKSANIRGLSGKYILKNVMRTILPDSIVFRKKLGFPTPWQYWLAGEQFESIERMLLESRTAARGLFQLDAIRRMLTEHRSGFRDHASRIWRLFTFELWCRVFLDGEAPNRDLLKDPRVKQVRVTP